jgi:RNA polymerase sigma factor (sigma-70 family)
LFRSWLRRIVERLGLNSLRSRHAQRRNPSGNLGRLDSTPPEVEPAATDTPPARRAEQVEQGRLIRQAVERLPDEEDRTIVRLRFFDGLSLRQIALRLGRNFEQLRQRFHAALRRLEHDLKGLS